MKKILLLFTLLFAFAIAGIQAQEKCPPVNMPGDEMVIQERAVAPDFSTTFTDGISANLYTTLAAGNTVVLDFFYTT